MNDFPQTGEAAAPVTSPEVLAVQRSEQGVILSLRIPDDLTYFDGHFDQIAIVPGVVQIQWAVLSARQYLGVTLAFSHMESIKFKELLLPGQLCELDLRYRQPGSKLEFCYRSESAEYSSGRIYFHDGSV